MVFTLVLAAITLCSLAIAAYAWWHAARWAKLIAYGRIVVEYKGKVKLDAPLREWALWCRQTRKDKAQSRALRGHVIYALGGTRVAIFSGVKPGKIGPVRPRPSQQGRQLREGKWSAHDDTVKS